MNFIFVSLCDNDFGHSLKEALEFVFTNKEKDLTEEEFKHFVVNYVVFHQSVRRIHPSLMVTAKDLERIRNYLEKNVTVYYLADKPIVDHDHGSAVLDVALNYAWNI